MLRKRRSGVPAVEGSAESIERDREERTINMACAERLAISVPFLPNVIICGCTTSQRPFFKYALIASSPPPNA